MFNIPIIGNQASRGGAAGFPVTSGFDPAFKVDANTTFPDIYNVKRVTSGSGGNMVSGTVPIVGNKFCEMTFVAYAASNDIAIGLRDSSATSNQYLGQTGNSAGFYQDSFPAPSGAGLGQNPLGLVACVLLYLPGTQTLHIFHPVLGWDANGTGDPVANTNGYQFTGLGATVYFAATTDLVNDQVFMNTGQAAWSNTSAIATITAGGYASAIG